MLYSCRYRVRIGMSSRNQELGVTRKGVSEREVIASCESLVRGVHARVGRWLVRRWGPADRARARRREPRGPPRRNRRDRGAKRERQSRRCCTCWLRWTRRRRASCASPARTSAPLRAGRAKLRLEHVGLVFQRFHLLPSLSARANVALPLVELGWSKRKRRERAEGLLDDVGLGDRATHRPDS